MKRLADPVVRKFTRPLTSPFIPAMPLENKAGQLFLGINEPTCPEDFHLYRWQEDGSWELIFSAPGLALRRNGFSPCGHQLSFDDPYNQCLVFTLYEPDHRDASVLLTVSYDGQTSSLTPADRFFHLSRFPGGDFLLLGNGEQEGSHFFLQRISPSGDLLWNRSKARDPADQWYFAQALPDQTTLLYTETGHSCRLIRLDREGEPLPTPALEEISFSPFPLPQVRQEDEGWMVEDCLVDLTDEPLTLPLHHFRRIGFDRDWTITETQTVSLPSSPLPSFTFYPDGVLVGQFRTQKLDDGKLAPCCQINWLDLATGQSSLLLTTKGLTPHLERPSLSLPLFRLEDGSYLFSLDVANANARGVLLGAAPDGRITWMKKYRCEGDRWLFPKGDRLVALWADHQGVRAETYRLPPSHP